MDNEKATGNDPFKDLTRDNAEQTGKKKKSGGFQGMGLDPPLYRAIKKIGYKIPTPIQRKCIPVILQGQDLVAMARTGSGKTAAFLIPLLQRLKEHKKSIGLRGVILSPTRELATQTMSFCQKLGKFTDLRMCLIVGGDSIENQFTRLAANPDIVVATPGRLRHLLSEVDKFCLKTVEYIVFDEGDRLFEMGFQEDIQEILNRCSPSRQTLLFSATLPSMLVSFARAGLNNPTTIRLDAESQLSENLEIQFFSVRNKEKDAVLFYLLREFIPTGKQILVFAATKHHVEYLHAVLSELYSEPIGVCIYGRMDPAARKINLAKFAKKKANVMFVTDLAARGIDIPLLDVVINYDFPPKPKLFVHRVGRVARAGRSGVAYSLLSKNEMPYVLDLMLFLGRKLVGSEKTEEKNAIHYGNFPSIIIESTQEQLTNAININTELQALQKSMVNSHKLYHKTRNPASRASAKRVKDLDYDHVHVLLKDLVDDSEVSRQDFLSQLKTFRPPQTIFDQPGMPESSAQIMEKTRNAHMGAIEREKKKKEEKKNKKVQNQELEERNDDTESDVRFSLGETKVQTFRDERFFMNLTPKNHFTEKGLEVEKDANAKIEDMVLDLIPDDSKTIFRKRTMMTWDKKKKRFIQVTQDTPSYKKGKVKTEGGQHVKTHSKKGKLYEVWSKKTKQSIGKAGEEEGVISKDLYQKDRERSRYRHHSNQKEKVRQRDELKSMDQIRRQRRIKEKRRERMTRGTKRKREDKKEGPRKKQRFNGAPTRTKMIRRRRK